MFSRAVVGKDRDPKKETVWKDRDAKNRKKPCVSFLIIPLYGCLRGVHLI